MSPASALSVVPFDAGRLRTTGDVLTLSDQLWLSAVGSANADLSASGSIVFQSGGSSLQVVLAAPGGTPQPLLAEPRQYQFPRFSPDGARVALTLGAGGRTDIWIYTLSSGVLTRLTTEGTANDRPEWSADGTRVLFRTDREGATSLWWQPADGSGPAARLLRIPGRDILEGVLTPDGHSLVYRTGVAGSAHIWYRRLDGDTAAVAFAPTLFSEWTPRISPDGKWMAYSSDESGAFQVYVRPFPGPGARYQVSVDGGNTPVWSRDGRHLFYPNGQQLLSATLAVTPTFSVTAREKLLEGNEYTFSLGHASYDVAPDGKRFLLLRPLNGETQTIVVVNWREELRARTAHNAARGATP